jgi:hypothetical protein
MNRDEDFYEIAFREVETGELDTALWAKAFALSADNDHAKKLYIQYRVAQIKNSSEADILDTSDIDSQTSIEQEPKLVQEPLPESKTSSWLDSFVSIILIVPPARLAGAWFIYLDRGGSFNKLEILRPTLDDGATWFTVLWPFALIYWLVKRNKNTTKSPTQFKKRFNDGQPQPSDFGGLIIFFLLIFVLIWFVEA